MSETQYKLMMPQAIWEDFDPSKPLEAEEIPVPDGKRYVFTALDAADGKVRVQLDAYTVPGSDSAPTVVIVGEYHRPPEKFLVDAIRAAGFNVVVPDYSKVAQDTKTSFPESFAYGEYRLAGEHILKVMPSAKETSQYLYSVIVKRAITLVRRYISDGKLVLAGMGDAVEVAMQVEGSGKMADALACLNGSGYREYIKHNRYGGGDELAIDEERMCWLTGVASVAYAKYISCPVFIAVGSNAHQSDIDRLQSLKALMASQSVHISISPRAGDFLLPEAFGSFLIWLHSVAKDTVSELPEIPELDIRINEEGIPYFDLDCDPASMIKKVQIFYAIGEYSHEVRDWLDVKGISVSYNEFIAQAEEYDSHAPLFAFGEVEYENGFSLSSTVGFIDLKGQPVKPPGEDRQAARNVVFDPSAGDDESGFVEDFDGAVLMKGGIKKVTTPSGLEGLTSEYGGLRTYRFKPQNADKEKFLKIEFYTDAEVTVEVALITSADGVRKYVASRTIDDTKGLFRGAEFGLQDFKEELTHRTPGSWDGVKALTIHGNNIIIGNILFI